jgi:fumarate reductase flavoprotein subunit
MGYNLKLNNSKEKTKMNPGQNAEIKNMEADVIVIGAGGSGMVAATQAAELGARVIVLEKQGAPGGGSLLTFGIFAVESPTQKRLEIGLTRDQAFRAAMDWAHWKIEPRIIRTIVNRSANTIQWLENKGLIFDDVSPIYNYFNLRTFHCIGENPTGRLINNALYKQAQDMGVKFFLHCPAKKLLTNSKGEITGVQAELQGESIKFKTQNVIIASGGFGANKELLKKYHPAFSDKMFYSGIRGNTGDGFLMAAEIGAAIEETNILLLSSHTYAPITSRNAASDICRAPQSIWVNKYGVRFCPEWLPDHENAVYRQPDKCLFTLFDDKFKKQYQTEKHYNSFRAAMQGQLPFGDLDKALQEGIAKGDIKIANTWVEIAQWMGVEPAVLEATVNEYNQSCDQGYDPIFNKDKRYLDPIRTPPYYAITAYQDYHSAVGNIKINHQMEVLNERDNPIPGLYAGGDTCSGWVADTYPIELSGFALAFAFNSGRIAAENAVKRLHL